MNVFRPHQRIIGRAARTAILALGLTGTALGAFAAPLETRTVRQAEAASLYDTYHDLETGFVFVKLPGGWRFVGRDVGGSSHELVRDAATGFVFVRLSDGWRFITSEG